MATEARRDVGWLPDVHGHVVKVSADCDGVVIHAGRQTVTFGPEERETFQRLFMEAERHAEAWTAEDAEQCRG